VRWTCAVSFTLCLSAAGAAAQTSAPPPDTREAELEALRRQKAQKLATNERGRVEALIGAIEDNRWMTRLFNPPNGPFATIGLAEGGGFGGGGGYRIGSEHRALTVGGAMSFTRYWIADTRFRADELAGGRLATEVFARMLNQPREDFFGLGPDSSESDRTSYDVDTFSAGALVAYELNRWMTVRGGAAYLHPTVHDGQDPRFPSIEERFSDADAPGLDDQPDFVNPTVAFTIDTRDPELNARAGGRYEVSFGHYADLDRGHYSFQRTRIELQQFVPFWNRFRVIALRALVERTDAGEDGEVPFYYQPTLGNSTTLRGYKTQRFRDLSALLLQAEYRYEINPFLMAAVFGDVGQVAPDWGDFRSNDLRSDYGFGLRFGYDAGVALRGDLAFGDEGPRFHLRFSGVF
jgi:Omp85 superfamily domain